MPSSGPCVHTQVSIHMYLHSHKLIFKNNEKDTVLESMKTEYSLFSFTRAHIK